MRARAERIIFVKQLHDRLLTYSLQYGRPVFSLTGVRHASPAESTIYEQLRLDLRDPRVRYRYDDRSFRITWYDSIDSPRTRRERIVVADTWPATAALYARTRWMVFHPGPYR